MDKVTYREQSTLKEYMAAAGRLWLAQVNYFKSTLWLANVN